MEKPSPWCSVTVQSGLCLQKAAIWELGPVHKAKFVTTITLNFPSWGSPCSEVGTQREVTAQGGLRTLQAGARHGDQVTEEEVNLRSGPGSLG